jgi:drug/metabolite transporter (DMT)-like permease
MRLWQWVGAIIGIYGIIVLLLGIFYFIKPENVTATSEYNPSLWWGLFMTIFSLFLFYISRKSKIE